MKFITWTMHKPANSYFKQFAELPAGEPWYSNKWVIKDKDAPEKNGWDYRKTSFLRVIEQYHEKMDSIGMHELMINREGRVYSYDGNENSYVLNSDKTDIDRPVANSLRYLMHTYPKIKWAMQFIAFQESVLEVLLNENKKDLFVDECYKIMKIYIDRGFPVQMLEIDFEHTWAGNGEKEAIIYRDLLVRLKNEVCLPLGLELRVNLFTMTDDFTPYYYAWHDYKTLASGRDKNGNMAIDEYQLMSYDFSWSGSAPGASAPLWWLKKALEHVKRVLPPERTYLGNAGFGRRWNLGEFATDSQGNPIGRVRGGSTLDYKQLMNVQNGAFIHNMGKTSPDGKFYFNDHDFIPMCGFNDVESDYAITYLNVYDKFKMSRDGGADTSGMDKSSGDYQYVTKYSKRQRSIFGGVESVVTNAQIGGIVDKSGTFVVNGVNGVPAEGLGEHTFNGYAITSIPDETTKPEDYPFIKYSFSGTGSKRLIAVVNFPFFDKDTMDISLNGKKINISIKNEWYPQNMLQTPHFYDLGVHTLNGSNKVDISYTKGIHIFGFIVCDSFDMNLTGGKIKMPTNTTHYKKRGETKPNGDSEIVNAQFPSNFRIVGEIIRRPPRPAIIWEDMFGSYGDNVSDITKGFRYYPKDAVNGFSHGVWKPNKSTETSYAHAYCNSKGSYGQLMLDNIFTTSMVCDVEIACSVNYGVYGVRFADKIGSSKDGYIAVCDYKNSKLQIVREVNGVTTVEKTVNMSKSLRSLWNSRVKLKVFMLDGKITLSINDYVYIKEHQVQKGKYAIGVWCKDSEVKCFKYNVSSIERWETLERIKTTIDGKSYMFGEQNRTCAKDEYGYLIYKGYPEEVKGSFPNNNITNVETDTTFSWEVDYINVPLCVHPSWTGEKEVEVETLDAGIWIRRMYVGDNEGMSIAYNSDIVGFIRTANMINDYGCKGVAMWTLGQEDPRVYSYLK